MIQASVIGFFNISGGEIFIIMIVVFLIFGPDKIPEIARWLGKGVGEIKKATSEIRDEITRETQEIQNEANKLKQDIKIENPLKKNPDVKSDSGKSSGDKKDKDGPEGKKPEPHL
jgi:sec-independent protein translocase protein TatA